MAGLYTNRIQAPTKELRSDWIPEEGEIFRDSSGNVYCGDNVTASDQLDPIGGGGGSSSGLVGLIRYTYSNTTSATGISAGHIRFDSTTRASITKCYIHDTDDLSIDQSDYLDLFTSGVLNLYNSSPEGMMAFKVTRMIERTGYHEFDVVPLSGVMPTSGDTVRVDAVMDAPGVRRYKAEIVINSGVAELSATHFSSVNGTIEITGDLTKVIVSGIDGSDVGKVNARAIVYSSTGDIHSVSVDRSAIVSGPIRFNTSPNLDEGDSVVVDIEVFP
jgi:hypothetical protein